jgi:hypothetical protein
VEGFGRVSLLLALLLPGLTAHTQNQQDAPALAEPQTGIITGYVLCDDTQAPARFASVLIIPIPVSDAGGKVTAASVPSSALFATLRSHDAAKTNLDGEYTLANIPPGSYFVLAELDGYLSPVWQFDEDDLKDMTPETIKKVTALLPAVQVEAGKTVHADITLERGASISGTVAYEDGTPAIGVGVRLEVATDDPEDKPPPLDRLMYRSTGISDDHGHYRINGWPAGKYVLGAALPGQTAPTASKETSALYLAQGGTITVYSDKTLHRKDAKVYTMTEGDDLSGVDVELPLHGLHSISGKVVAEGDQPGVVWGLVYLQDINDWKFNSQTVISADGSFQFFNMPQGNYKLTTRNLSDVVPQSVQPSPASTPYSYKDVSTTVEVTDKDLNGVAIVIPGSTKPTEGSNPQNPE